MKKAILYIFSFLSVLLMVACSTNNSEERKSSDSVQLIRNAILKINYAGKTILVDPLFSGKGELQSILGVNRNPTVHLTMPIEEIVSGVDFALGTHSHFDHCQTTRNILRNEADKAGISPERLIIPADGETVNL